MCYTEEKKEGHYAKYGKDSFQPIHTPALDTIMCGITRLGNGGVFWLSLGLLLLLKPSKVRAGLILFIAIGLEVLLCNGLLKH